MIGQEMARRVLDRYGTNDLETILKTEGIQVRPFPRWNARFHDVFVSPILAIPKDIGEPLRRSILAHALGHHFLHTGNQMWLRGYDRTWNAKQEYQAEEFAAWLTIPAEAELDIVYMSPGEVARRYRVIEELVRVRTSAL